MLMLSTDFLLNFYLLSRSMVCVYVCVDGCGNEALIKVYRAIFFSITLCSLAFTNKLYLTKKRLTKKRVHSSYVKLICDTDISITRDISELLSILIVISW